MISAIVKTSVIKITGLIMAGLLIATFLVFMPITNIPAAHADTTPPPSTPPVPSKIDLAKVDNPDGSISLQATLDVPLEPSSSTAYLYQVGNDTPVDQVTTGSLLTFPVVKPAIGFVQYKVKVGNISSNIVTLTSDTSSWTITLEADKNEFDTSEASPNLTWKTNQSIAGSSYFAVYIANIATGNIVSSNKTSTFSSSYNVSDFSKGDPREYIAYIAKYSTNVTNVSSLTEIVASSNSLFLSRKAWTITLSVNKDVFTVGDSNPVLTWKTNQPINRPGQTYSVYIYDKTAQRYVYTSSESPGTSGQISTGFYSGEPHDYIAYVAAYTLYSTPPASSYILQDIQATSNVVSTSRTAWSISLSIDKTAYSTDETAPVISWALNQNISQTGNSYSVYIYDKTAGRYVINAPNGGKTGSVTVGFYTGAPHEYVGYVAKYTSYQNLPAPTYVMEDVQATSNVVSTSRAAWSISLSVDKPVFSTSDTKPMLTWNLNQTISKTGNSYSVYIYDKTAERYVVNAPNGGKTGSVTVGFYAGAPHEYVGYVAKYTSYQNLPAPTYAMEDVQATSNIVSVKRAPWSVDLKSSISSISSANKTKTVDFTVAVNQPVDYTNNSYSIYIYDKTANKYIYNNPNIHVTSFKASLNVSYSSTSFVAYVAKYTSYQNLPAPGYVMEDVQAMSGVSLPDQNAGPVYPNETTGGSNPSEANCQSCKGDPINTATGEFFENDEDLVINSTLSLSFVRSYSSTRPNTNVGLGKGWTHSYNMKLVKTAGQTASTLVDSNQLDVSQENGSTVTFSKVSDGVYISANRVFATLSYSTDDNTFTFTRNNGYAFKFDATGKLLNISDRNSNSLTFTYNTDENLIKVLTNKGQWISLTWNSGNISSVQDNAGRSVAYTYDTSSRLTKVSPSTVTNSKIYGYNTANLLTTITDYNGGVTTNTYDTSNRVTNQKQPGTYGDLKFAYNSDGSTLITYPFNSAAQASQPVTKEAYNSQGQLVSSTTGFGTSEAATTAYEYGDNSQVTKITDPEGKTNTFSYDTKGNLLTKTDGNENVTSYTYNSFNQVLTTTNALNKTATNVYDANGNLIEQTTFAGRKTQYTVNSDGTKATSKAPNQVAAGTPEATVFTYDMAGFLASATAPNGGTTTRTNNSLGQPVSITDAKNNETTYEYDSNQRLSKTIATDGGETVTTYDSAGRVASVTDATGMKTSYTYDEMDNVKTVTNAAGTTQYDYDALHRKYHVKDATGREIRYRYDLAGNLISTTDRKGKVSTQTWTKNGRLASKTDNMGRTTTYTYDNAGNVTKVHDANSLDSTATYDALNRLVTSTNPEGITETTSYDDDGNKLSVTQNNNTVIQYVYDTNGNQIKTIDAGGKTLETTYDAENNRIQSKDSAGSVTTFEYNELNQLNKTTRPDGTSLSYTYTPMGQIETISADNGATVQSSYTYDFMGHVKTDSKDGVVTTYSYDAMGNLLTRGSGATDKVKYTYNNAQQVASIEYPSGITVSYTYDNNDNLVDAKLGTTAVAHYTYNENNLETNVTLANSVEETRTYDLLNHEKGMTISKDGTQMYSKQLALNGTGFAVASSVTDGETQTDKSYEYDNIQRLGSVQNGTAANTYAFDGSNNLLGTSEEDVQTYNTASQVATKTTPAMSTSYAYDARGNRVQKVSTPSVEGSTPATTDYSWTADNKLNSVTSAGQTINYSYEAAGLLSKKTTGTSTETFVWDTQSMLPTLLEDGKYQYIYGNDKTPVAQINKTTGAIDYLHGDSQNSIVFVTNANGNKEASYAYTPYGMLESETGDNSHSLTNFGYAGQYQDTDSGLYYMRARWYDPETGNFISVDPLLPVTLTPYGYTAGNPLFYSDPMGLDYSIWFWEWDAQGWHDFLSIIPKLAVGEVCNASIADVCKQLVQATIDSASVSDALGGADPTETAVGDVQAIPSKWLEGRVMSLLFSLVPGGKFLELIKELSDESHGFQGFHTGAGSIQSGLEAIAAGCESIHNKIENIKIINQYLSPNH